MKTYQLRNLIANGGSPISPTNYKKNLLKRETYLLV